MTRERGRLLDSDLAERVLATAHPSSILRQQGDESRHAELEAFVRDPEGGRGGPAAYGLETCSVNVP